MKNSILYIVGAVALLGGGAFLFLKNKKLKDTLKLADINQEKALELEKVDDKQAPNEQALKLKDEISVLMQRKNAQRLPVFKNVMQARIDKNLVDLLALGYVIDSKNELIKIK